MTIRKLLLAATTSLCAALPLAANAATVTALASTTPVEFDVILPLHDTAGLQALLQRQQDPTSADYHKWLTPAQFGARFGASAATKQALASELAKKGLIVSIGSRGLHVKGSADAVGRTFATKLAAMTMPNGHLHTVSTAALTLPASLTAAGAIVPAFSSSAPRMHTMARYFKLPDQNPANRTSSTGGYWYGDLKQAYNYPAYTTMITSLTSGKQQRLDGTGATIATLIGSDVLDSDSNAVFDHEKFSKTTGLPDPVLYARRVVAGGAPFDADNNPDSFEASLDVQELLTGAPGAHSVLYNIPDLSDESIIAGYTAIDEDNSVDVVSSSFGGCELAYGPAYNNGVDYTGILNVYNELFQQGNAQGITFLASSGDEAGLECPQASYLSGQKAKFIASVSEPASFPNVTAVGGGNVVTTSNPPSLASKYVDENAYSDPEIPYDIYALGTNVSGGSWGAGGGVSTLFTTPAYQAYTKTGSAMRTLPDIGMQVGGCPGGIAKLPCNGGDTAKNGAGNTDRSYVIISVGGTFEGVIGTSVSSPEFASVVALLVEQHGRQGNLNNYIYSLATKQAVFGGAANTAYHQGIPGYNGVVQNSKPGGYYNYTYGVGSPFVYRFVGLPGATVAGKPQTISNP